MSYESLGIFWTCVCSFLSLKTQTPSSMQPPNPAIGQIPSTLSSEYICRQQLPHLLYSQSIRTPFALIITCPRYSNIFLLFFFPQSLIIQIKGLYSFTQHFFKNCSLLDLEQILDRSTEEQWHLLWELLYSRTSSATSFSLVQPHSWAKQFVIPDPERKSCCGYPWIRCWISLSVPPFCFCCCLISKSYPTFCDAMDCSPPGSSTLTPAFA